MRIKEGEALRDYLSANIKARRDALHISQERLAEMADVSIQMIKGIEGRRSWVSDKMLARLAVVLEVEAFQLLVPADSPEDHSLVSSLLRNLRQNIHDDIDARFDSVG